MVAPFVAAAGLSALSSLGGGLLGMFGAKKAQRRAEKREDTAIARRVADAQKAGIHPLYALGANVSPGPAINTFAPLAESLGSMGQDISRAVSAGGSQQDRVLTALQLERAGLENELLKVQISNARAPAVGPGSPVGSGALIPGQGDSMPATALPYGVNLPADPSIHSAQAAEDARGEIADFVYGMQTLEQIVASPDFQKDMGVRMRSRLQPHMLGEALARGIGPWWRSRVALGRPILEGMKRR